MSTDYQPRHRRDVPMIVAYDHRARLVAMPVTSWDEPTVAPADARHRLFTTGDVLIFNNDGTVTLEVQP